MANPYRGHSRHSSSSGSPHYGQSHLAQVVPSSSHYSSPAPAQYSYPAPSPGQFEPTGSSQSTYGYYSSSSLLPMASASAHSHSRTSSVPMHSTYSVPATSSTSERASKRQKGGAVPPQGAYMQGHRTSAPVQADPKHIASRSHGRESSASSRYNSPGYSHSHDAYGQQHFQPPSIPGVGPSAMRDARFYGASNSHNNSSEYEEEEEERLDHGPTELPPRTYSGKSKYDQPRKPGKIPGSAMDFLPILEARFDRLETAIDRYVDYRGQRALSNSILPGTNAPEGSSSSSYYSRPSRK